MEAGDQLGNYVIKDRLGRGATAEVFRALQPAVERDVAIKVMFPHLTDSSDFAVRFQREARAMGQLQHPNITRIIDFDADAERPYIVMEYLVGGTLHDVMQRTTGPMDSATSLRIARQLADALRYAHDLGMVHRDIKPGNVLFTDDSLGCAMLTDFGMARLVDDSATATGTMLGTPAFMAPEQIRGEPVSGRSDIYSLGVMLFEMVTGTAPYDGDSIHSLMMKHADDPIPSAIDRAGGVDPELDRLIRQMLAKRPEDRPADAGEVVAALDRLLGGTGAGPAVVAPGVKAASAPTGGGSASSSAGRSWLGLAAAAVAVVAIALGTVFALTRGGPDSDGTATDAIAEETGAEETATEEAGTEEAGAEETGTEASSSSTASDDPAALAESEELAESEDLAESEELAESADETEAPPAAADEGRLARDAFDPANPPPIFVTSAQMSGDDFVLAWDRTRRARGESNYLLLLDDAVEPLAILQVDADRRGVVAVPTPAHRATSIVIAADDPTAGVVPVIYEHAMSEAQRAALDTRLDAHLSVDREMAIVVDHTGFIADALGGGDLDEARRHTEHVINIIDGSEGPLFGDLDQNGLAENPGDGIGVVTYASEAGPDGSQAVIDLQGAQSAGVRLLSSDSVDEASRAFADLEPLIASSVTTLVIEQSELKGEALKALVGPLLALTGTDSSIGSISLLTEAGGIYVSTTLPTSAGQVTTTANGQSSTIGSGGFSLIPDVDPTTLGEVTLRSADGTQLASGRFSEAAIDVWLTLTGESGIIARLDEQAQLVADHADFMVVESGAGDHGEARRHAEHLVNMIVGESDELFGDLDGDGVPQNPGDGVGLLPYLLLLDGELGRLDTDSIEQHFYRQQFSEAVVGIRTQVDAVRAEALRVLATDTAEEAAPLAAIALAAGAAALDGFDTDQSGHLDSDETGIRGLAALTNTLLSAPLEP